MELHNPGTKNIRLVVTCAKMEQTTQSWMWLVCQVVVGKDKCWLTWHLPITCLDEGATCF